MACLVNIASRPTDRNVPAVRSRPQCQVVRPVLASNLRVARRSGVMRSSHGAGGMLALSACVNPFTQRRMNNSRRYACVVAADVETRAARSVSSHAHDDFRQKFSIIQALFAEVYSKKARWWPSGDGMAYAS
jgi:hypothetical protein